MRTFHLTRIHATESQLVELYRPAAPVKILTGTTNEADALRTIRRLTSGEFELRLSSIENHTQHTTRHYSAAR